MLRGMRFVRISYAWSELNFAEGLDENPYKHLQDYEEICATLMTLGMNHETLKVDSLSVLANGMEKK
jgi:hypothetical protein